LIKKLVLILYWISVSVWEGGLVVLSILVAPALFKTLESRAQAGQAFGAILRSFAWIELGCALAACASAGWLVYSAENRRWIHWAQIGVLIAMALLAAIHDLSVLPSMAQIRQTDLRRFEQLHRLSVSMVGANILLGLVLVAGSALVPEFACKTRAGG